MLLLIACDLGWIRGVPGDIAAVAETMRPLIDAAETVDHHGRKPSAHRICAIYRVTAGRLPEQVAKYRHQGVWVDRNGDLLRDIREGAFEPDWTPAGVDPLPDEI